MVEVLSSETVHTTGLGGREKSSGTARHSQSLFSRMHPWIASLTALAALVISTIVLVRQSGYPEIIVTLPPRIRVEIDDSTSNPNLMFIQPTFSVVEKTDRVGLVSSMRVELKKRGGPEELRLQWDETGEWRLNPEGRGTTYEFMADPTPLVITQEAPRSPQALFQTNGKYTAGTWDAMLIVNRAADQPDLKIPFCLIMQEELVNRMNERLGSTISLWNDTANGSTVENRPAQCYERL
jgi:hypothetical protein